MPEGSILVGFEKNWLPLPSPRVQRAHIVSVIVCGPVVHNAGWVIERGIGNSI